MLALNERLDAVRDQSARARRLAAEQPDRQVQATLTGYADEMDAEARALEHRMMDRRRSVLSRPSSAVQMRRARAARANDY